MSSATCTGSGGRTSPSTGRSATCWFETGRAQPHHVLPHTGWVSKQIRGDDDVGEVIELFRLSYERARVAKRVRESHGSDRQ